MKLLKIILTILASVTVFVTAKNYTMYVLISRMDYCITVNLAFCILWLVCVPLFVKQERLLYKLLIMVPAFTILIEILLLLLGPTEGYDLFKDRYLPIGSLLILYYALLCYKSTLLRWLAVMLCAMISIYADRLLIPTTLNNLQIKGISNTKFDKIAVYNSNGDAAIDLRAQKKAIIILTFISCSPCRLLNKFLADKDLDSKIPIIRINVVESLSEIQNKSKNYSAGLSHYKLRDTALERQLQNNDGYPVLLFLNEGVVTRVSAGFGENLKTAATNTIDSFLKY